MIAAPRPAAFVLKGWHVLLAFMAFFGADIAVNTVFMMSAYKTFPGETSLTPYEDGVAYNATLRQRRAQSLLGWRLTTGMDGAGRLRFEAADRNGVPIDGLRVSAHLERPATDQGERDVVLKDSAKGVYLGAIPPLGGAWDVEVTARDGQGRIVKADRRMAIP